MYAGVDHRGLSPRRTPRVILVLLAAFTAARIALVSRSRMLQKSGNRICTSAVHKQLRVMRPRPIDEASRCRTAKAMRHTAAARPGSLLLKRAKIELFCCFAILLRIRSGLRLLGPTFMTTPDEYQLQTPLQLQIGLLRHHEQMCIQCRFKKRLKEVRRQLQLLDPQRYPKEPPKKRKNIPAPSWLTVPKYRCFADPEAARQVLERLRWPDKITCPHCALTGTSARLWPRESARRPARPGVWRCTSCRKQFTVTIGTIFEGSHVPLHKWLLVIHFACYPGASSTELHRAFGITSKSAARMLTVIKRALYPGAGQGQRRKRRYRSKRLHVDLNFRDAVLRLLSTAATTHTDE